MKVLIVGQGGREHAIIKSLLQSPKIEAIYCAPGNGGIEQDAICLPTSETDFKGLAEIVKKENIDLTIVGPEKPLLAGIVDYFQEQKLAIIGPTKNAAQLEGSKAFAKELMIKHNIPTANYAVFVNKDKAVEYLKDKGAPIVIKADGLAAGKGVIVAETIDQALNAINEIMEEKKFGEAGNKVVIEEFLEGEELTLMAFVEGKTILPMEPAQDHKQVYDGDKGPNTGGMGSYSPVPHIAKDMLKEIYDNIVYQVADALVAEGIYYSGILYFGLMLTKNGPKVIEFNARFGDPETQAVLPRLETDLIEIFTAIQSKRLKEIELVWSYQSAICVVLAAQGYPNKYQVGKVIKTEDLPNDLHLFYSGVKRNEHNQLVTAGGRVLGITALDQDLIKAQKTVYKAIDNTIFEGAHYRKDIGSKAIRKAIN